MRIERFEDILAWQKAKQLTLGVYTEFRFCKDFGFRDQLQRASVSIMNNIAEGFERKGNKEFAHFLFIAKASCGEVRSMLHLTTELGYLSSDRSKEYSGLSIEVSKLLSGFIKTLR